MIRLTAIIPPLPRCIAPRMRTHWALALLVALLCAPSRAQDEAPQADQGRTPSMQAATEPLVAAGERRNGWVAKPGSGAMDPPRLYHIPAGLEPGAILRGPQLRRIPVEMAADNNTLLLVFPPQRVGAPRARGDAEPLMDRTAKLLRPAERIAVVAGTARGVYGYRPLGPGGETLPALPGRGQLLGFTMHQGSGVALLRDEHGELSLRVLRNNAWRETTLPDDIAPEGRFRLLALPDGLTLVQHAGDGTRAWRAVERSGEREPQEDNGAAPLPFDWTERDTGVRAEDEFVAVAGSQIIAGAREDSGEISLRLVRGDASYDLATVGPVPPSFAVAPVGETVQIVWRGEGEQEADRRLHVAVVSVVSGAVLFEGPAGRGAVVSARELQALALMLGALMLTILVFVLRPEDAIRETIVLPDGYALAEPGRRALAALIDVVPPIAVFAIVLRVQPADLVAAAMLSDEVATRAAVSVFAGVGVAMAHSALSEWIAGRTLGKLLLGARTCSVKGTKPGLWQATLRNVVKLLFPPFALFLFIDPRRRHPGDLAAGTVVIARIPASTDKPDRGASKHD